MNTTDSPPAQLVATAATLELIGELRQQHGPLVLFQSAGCCEGSAPICLLQSEFLVGPNDRLLGDVGGVPFYITLSQFDYLKHGQMILDVTTGASGSFSLEQGHGCSFLLRSRLFDADEYRQLQAAGKV